jgi:Txe/YoeB family toxin of toxin-antitoxin system
MSGKTIGYISVSTFDQNPQRQLDGIYLDKKFTDKASGKDKRDFKKITKSHLKDEIYKLLQILKQNTFQNPPPFKKFVGIYVGAYSRRINIQHRLFYIVEEKTSRIKVISIWC